MIQIETLHINIDNKTPQETINEIEMFIEHATTRMIRFEIDSIMISCNQQAKEYLGEFITEDIINVNSTNYKFVPNTHYNKNIFKFYFIKLPE